jgi:hypothetical protein
MIEYNDIGIFETENREAGFDANVILNELAQSPTGEITFSTIGSNLLEKALKGIFTGTSQSEEELLQICLNRSILANAVDTCPSLVRRLERCSNNIFVADGNKRPEYDFKVSGEKKARVAIYRNRKSMHQYKPSSDTDADWVFVYFLNESTKYTLLKKYTTKYIEHVPTTNSGKLLLNALEELGTLKLTEVVKNEDGTFKVRWY